MFVAIGLILVAVAERLWFDLGPNVELVTAATILTGLYLPGKYRVLVPLVIMVVSDWVLGWGEISIFTWSGFVMMGMLPRVIRQLVDKRSAVVVGTVSGLVGNVMFYWWTNWGVWLTDRWGMYSHNVDGLMQCYINGLPFLKLQMVSTLMFLPVSILVAEEVKKWVGVVRFGVALRGK